MVVRPVIKLKFCFDGKLLILQRTLWFKLPKCLRKYLQFRDKQMFLLTFREVYKKVGEKLKTIFMCHEFSL